MARRANPFSIYYKLSMLALESQQVIALRLLKIGRGGAAGEAESRLMGSEKIETAVKTSAALARGGSASALIDTYRKKVRSNRKRLAKRK